MSNKKHKGDTNTPRISASHQAPNVVAPTRRDQVLDPFSTCVLFFIATVGRILGTSLFKFTIVSQPLDLDDLASGKIRFEVETNKGLRCPTW